MTIDGLTRAAALSRLEELHQRTAELTSKHRQSKGDEAELLAIDVEFDQLTGQVRKLDQSAVIAGAARGGGGDLRIESGSPQPFAATSRGTRSPAGESAIRQLERSVKAGLPARAAELVERLLDDGSDVDRSWMARYVTDSGSDAYRSAFGKLLLHGEARAGLEWTAAERDAYNRVSRLKSERGASLTDSAGGFLVPYEVDFNVNITSAGSISPLLEIARVQQTISDIWHGISSVGVQASWDAEASEVSDDSPPFAEPAIPAYKAACFVPFSIELESDATALLGQVTKLMTDGMTQLLNTALTTGSGTGSPTGIVTALTGGSSVVDTATAATLAAEDVYALQSSAAPRFQQNASWVANLAILNALRQMETSNGALKFPSLQDSVPTLLGRPIRELSTMDNTVAAGKNLLVYGDFSQFVVTQRVGSAVELVQHLFGANQRPTGQRGVYYWGRWGSDSINDAAFRMLKA